jgi:integrase
VTIPKAPRRMEAAMLSKTDTKTTEVPSLQDVHDRVRGHKTLSKIRRRDLCSAVRRVAFLLGDDPGHLALDVPVISVRLARTNPAAAGLTSKRFTTVKSDFKAAVVASGLKPIPNATKVPFSTGWTRLMAEQSAKRAQIGLSRLARYASAKELEPEEINDAALTDFINEVRQKTLHRKPNDLHRKVALIWNEVVQRSHLDLKSVKVPSFRRPPQWIEWTLLPLAFRKNVDAFLDWSAGADPYAANARPRALAPATIKLRRAQIHAAATALVESGVSAKTIRSLRDLVSPRNVKRILRRRNEMVGGRENMFNHDLAWTLVEIARRWVKVDPQVRDELKRLVGRVPTPVRGLTSKNKTTLRQFDDPANLRKLFDFPNRLWAEVKRDTKPDSLTLLKAQAALAVGILCYMPIRPQNLSALKFDEHLFLRETPGAISSLELPAHEVKNRIPLAFDIPPHLVKMLIEYRNRLSPKVIGRRPERLFIKADGTAKNPEAVRWLIRVYLRKRAGLQVSPHQFRHLGAKVLLDAEPGNFETVRQLLGHASQHTSVNAYAGISSRRAARHHQRLVEEALAAQAPRRGR